MSPDTPTNYTSERTEIIAKFTRLQGLDWYYKIQTSLLIFNKASQTLDALIDLEEVGWEDLSKRTILFTLSRLNILIETALTTYNAAKSTSHLMENFEGLRLQLELIILKVRGLQNRMIELSQTK